MPANMSRKSKPNGARYPWAVWFDQASREPLTLKQGEHYNSVDSGFMGTIRQAARRMGVSVSVNVHSGYVVLTVKK